MLVLIADNSHTTREFIGQIMAAEGHGLVMAEDGLSALRTIREKSPDLVILDVVMPKIPGDQVCRFLKNNHLLRLIPVVMISGACLGQEERLLAAGADVLVAKNRPELLRQAMLKVLALVAERKLATWDRRQVLGAKGVRPRAIDEELISERRQHWSFLERVAEGVAFLDETHCVYFLNQAFCRALGVQDSLPLLGREFWDLFPHGERPEIRRMVEHPSPGAPSRELTMGGRHYLLNSYRGLPEDEATSVILMLDISERKASERAIRESEDRLRTIMQALPAGMVLIDPAEYRVTGTNPAALAMLDLGEAELVGQPCAPHLCPRQAKGVCPLPGLGSFPQSREGEYRRTGRTRLPVLKTVVPIVSRGARADSGNFPGPEPQHKARWRRCALEASA